MINRLYSRGYLFTNDNNVAFESIGVSIEDWNCQSIQNYKLYVHRFETSFTYKDKDKTYVLIGHAYNPFSMEANECRILEAISLCQSEHVYREYIDQLTGVFILISICDNGDLTILCDCAGMMGAYYSRNNDLFYLSSHAQMIADLNILKEDPYVTALKKTKTFHLYGLFLPYDLSPYKEVKRIIPNTEIVIKHDGSFGISRFYPREPYSTEKDYDDVVSRCAQLLHNNLVLISQKWKNPAISLTGGTDSKTTLACAGDVQNCFLYFSYISLPREATDANAAQQICKALQLSHEIYKIDTEPSHYEDFSIFDKLIERQYGYLGKGNINDVCKRISLISQFHSDIEVKSWVSEVARASRYNIYQKTKFPEQISARMLTSMYKVFTYDRWNAVRTDKHFKAYLQETELQKRITETKYPWTEFFVWEIVFGGWGGLALSCEHKISNSITVPYNNRAIIDLMLRTPLEKRRTDQLHRDIMDAVDPRINALGIHVVNGNETKKRQIAERLYFDIHSHIPF